MGDFRVGDALGKGFSIWIRNLPSFLILAVVAYSPVLAYTGYVLSGGLDGESFTTWGWVVQLMSFPIDLLVTAAVLYGTIQQLRGQHAGIGASVAVGIKRLLPVLGVGILSAFAMAAPFLLVVIAVFVDSQGLVVLGGLAGIIPFIIIYCMLYVAVPAAVVEQPGVVGALRRSRELTTGYRGSIFGIVLVLGVLGFIVNKLIQSVFLGDAPSMDEVRTFTWVAVGVEIMMSALFATVTGVVYHDLRLAKDGVETEDLARVFE